MKRTEIPSLDDLRAFEAVARLGSVREAADSLALTHGAVSRRITKLTQELGFRLFEKSGRGLQLTPAGQTLNLTISRFFGELSATVQSLRTQSTEQSALVLSCESSVAMRWLIPRLGGFQDAHPGIALHLSVGGGAVDFRRDHIALAIRRLDFALPEHWQVQRLFAERVGPVMAPQQVTAFERGGYIALGSRTRPDAWAQWLKAHALAPRPAEIRYYDHHFLCVEAASAGLGVAMAPEVLAMDDVLKGRLAAPCGFQADGSHYGLLWLGAPQLDGAQRELADWLVAQCAGLAQPQPPPPHTTAPRL